MIVVDTNVIGYLYLTSERSGQSEAALRKDPEWAAPTLWRSELANVLSTYLRADQLVLSDALAIMSSALDLMRGREYEVSPLQVLTLAATSGCSAYDCEYIALAEDLKTILVTTDKQLLREFPTLTTSLRTFAETAEPPEGET